MGVKRSCVKFKKVKARSAAGTKLAFRCVEFEAGRKYPKCPGGLKGRSQNYIRKAAHSTQGCGKGSR